MVTAKHSMTVAEMGRKGGNARAAKLTAAQRAKVARLGARARWGKAKRKKASAA